MRLLGICVCYAAKSLYREIGCWPWDICAGSIIAQEAGGLVAGSHSSPLDNDLNEQILIGRKYVVIRAIGDTAVRLAENTSL